MSIKKQICLGELIHSKVTGKYYLIVRKNKLRIWLWDIRKHQIHIIAKKELMMMFKENNMIKL